MNLTIKSKVNNNIIKPGPLYVTNGSFSGEVNLLWDAIELADKYLIEISQNGNGWNQIDITTDAKYSLEGLTKGRTYFFRISAMMKGIRSGWSEAVSKKIK